MGKNLRIIVSSLWPKRSWFQYSLATMFFVVTVFCLWLGWVVDRATRQREAVRALSARDAIVIYDSPCSLDDHPRADETRLRHLLREILGDDYFCRAIDVLFLSKSRFDDDAIAALKRLPALSHLTVVRKPITATYICAFAQLKKLKSLSLHHVQLTDVDCRQLGLLTDLESLSLYGTAISDHGLAHLATLGKLTDLCVPSELLESEALARLEQSLPRCQVHVLNVKQIRGTPHMKRR